MRILIVPLITSPRHDAAYYLTRSMIAAFVQKRHAVAVSTSIDNGFRNISLYPETKVHKPLFPHKEDNASYEGMLCRKGAGSVKYLQKDLDTVYEIIDHFHPDLIISIDRIAAIVAAKAREIPCWTTVCSAAYRNVDVKEAMAGFNQILTSEGMDTAFTLKEIYDLCDLRIGFSPASVQPFKAGNIQRLGIQSIQPLLNEPEDRICVYLGETSLSSGKLKKIMNETFANMREEVRICYPGSKLSSEGRIRYLADTREDLLSGCTAVIHEGNAWMMNACIARGIPQIIIADHSYLRSWHGQMIERAQIGIRIQENELSSDLLTKALQQLQSTASYRENSMRLMNEAQALGDLTALY